MFKEFWKIKTLPTEKACWFSFLFSGQRRIHKKNLKEIYSYAIKGGVKQKLEMSTILAYPYRGLTSSPSPTYSMVH